MYQQTSSRPISRQGSPHRTLSTLSRPAARSMSITGKTYGWRTYDIYTEHASKFRREFIRMKPIWERYGAKVLGQYRVCAGDANLFINFLEFPNAQVQLQGLFEMRKDPDYMALEQEVFHCVRTLRTPQLRPVPFWPVQTPSPNSKLVVRRYTIRGVPSKALELFKPALQSAIDKYIIPGGMRLVGAFFPAYTNTLNAIYVVIELPDDGCVEKMEEWIMHLWLDTGYSAGIGQSSFADVVTGMSMKMFAPAQRSIPHSPAYGLGGMSHKSDMNYAAIDDTYSC